jgi:hypothetical protein
MPQQGVDSEFNLAWDGTLGDMGRVYVVFTEPTPPPGNPNNFTDLDIKLMYSDDAGATWHAPVKVSDAPAGTFQFLPSIAIDEAGRVPWGGTTRGTTRGQRAQFFAAVSNDHGATFASNVQLSAGSSDATTLDISVVGRPKGYGDYSTIAFTGGVLRPVWSDNSQALDGIPIGRNSRSLRRPSAFDVGAAGAAIRSIPIEVIQGEAFNGAVASFTHPDVGLGQRTFRCHDDPGVTGETSPITQPGGPGLNSLDGSHVYTQAGAYPLWVHVRDLANNLDSTPVSNVTAMQGSQAEATIAIDPTNPNRVFAAAVEATKRDLPSRGLPVSVSNDGGVTWASRVIADGSDSLPHARADPRAVFDQFGNLFLTYLSVTKTPGTKVVVVLSTDGGAISAALRFPARVEDFPSITVGPGQEPGQEQCLADVGTFSSESEPAARRLVSSVRSARSTKCLSLRRQASWALLNLISATSRSDPTDRFCCPISTVGPASKLNIHLDPGRAATFGPAMPVTEQTCARAPRSRRRTRRAASSIRRTLPGTAATGPTGAAFISSTPMPHAADTNVVLLIPTRTAPADRADPGQRR